MNYLPLLIWLIYGLSLMFLGSDATYTLNQMWWMGIIWNTMGCTILPLFFGVIFFLALHSPNLDKKVGVKCVLWFCFKPILYFLQTIWLVLIGNFHAHIVILPALIICSVVIALLYIWYIIALYHVDKEGV